jgi:hypothetical protein
MRTVRFSSTRAAPALIVALAAMLLIFAGSDTATAHEFNPMVSGSVSDPEPGAHADLTVSFALNAPDSLPTDYPPTVLFIPAPPPTPGGWGINADAPLGAIGGVFDALVTIGILGITPCTFSITFAPDMYVASTDTSNLTSALDLEGHPGGGGYSGQFVPDGELYGGITHYPDFLTEMFPPDQVGEPLMRLWGGQNVLLSAVSMNILIFEPGQLPEDQYPAEWGYPVVFVLMNPVAPPDLLMLTITSDLCTPLSLVNTHFGISRNNPHTQSIDEGGYVLLTNPKKEGDYTFTLKTTSMPDADDPPDEEHGDGIENSLDTCPFDPNTEDVDGRMNDGDGDGLDGACDPDPLNPSPPDPSGFGIYDEDQDNYGNRADNCPLDQNGIEMDVDSIEMKQVGEFVFPFALYTDLIGPDNQKDTDGDRIGDVCEGSEHGGQCANAFDDDGDDVVNDGCPTYPPSSSAPERGDHCLNDLDDDDDGAVNDGCPPVSNAETGAECANATDDDGDGLVNDGCPTATLVGDPETGAQCANATDDDGDDVVNDGCPAADPGDVAKSTPTGRIYTRTLPFPVPIYRHGVSLDSLHCRPNPVPSGGSAVCTVRVGNESDVREEIQVALRVLPAGCAMIDGDPDQSNTVVSVGPHGHGVANFTVDWSACPDGEYTVQADACHAGDPAPAGFFGFGACPGTPCDGGVDTNPKNDVAMSIIVNVR